MAKELIGSFMLLGLLATPAFAQQRPATPAPPTLAVTTLSGAWEMSSEDGRAKCRLTLRSNEAPGGRAIGFPASCRRALPALAKVAAWTVSPTGTVQLNDNKGAAIVAFAEAPEPFKLKGSVDNRNYVLDSLGRTRRFVERPPAPAGAQQRGPATPANAPAFETLPGLYSMIRPGDQEVCRINLSLQPGAQDGRYLTSFPARCRDRGLQVFDAVAWRYSGGKLFLIARRGHEIPLVPGAPSQWTKDPPARSDLMLRKIP